MTNARYLQNVNNIFLDASQIGALCKRLKVARDTVEVLSILRDINNTATSLKVQANDASENYDEE